MIVREHYSAIPGMIIVSILYPAFSIENAGFRLFAGEMTI
jgi:hypothetical protein